MNDTISTHLEAVEALGKRAGELFEEAHTLRAHLHGELGQNVKQCLETMLACHDPEHIHGLAELLAERIAAFLEKSDDQLDAMGAVMLMVDGELGAIAQAMREAQAQAMLAVMAPNAPRA